MFFVLLIKILLIHPSSTNSLSFDFPHFTPNVSQIQFQNDTFWANNNAIELTKDVDTPNRLESVGWATYAQPIQLWDATTGRLTDFDTHFSFIIGSIEAKGNGDGITFFLAPFGSKVPPRSSGGSLALFVAERADDPRKNRVVAVEFDTFQNTWDPSPDHVGINVNSIVSVANVSWNSSMKDGRTASARVTYNSTTKNLSVFLAYDEDAPVFGGNSVLYHTVDLSKVLPQRIMVGFSGSAGWTAETHRVLSWQFSSTLEIGQNPKNVSDMHSGNGSKTDHGSNIGLLLVGIVAGLGVFGCGFCIALVFWWKKRGSSRSSKANSNMDNEFERGTGPKKFSYGDLVLATNNFDEGRKLGEGGFGGVYKGFLSNVSLNVAVKRVSRGSKQGIKEYQSEVKIISKLRHRNLVQLIGWCHERNDLLLVYEFMPNRSLDKHLFQGENGLTWDVRYKIALGLASALLYLHEAWEECVLHRDIKSSNVMLDSNFNAKLGDFGLARLVDHDRGSKTTVIAGTRGYLAPECFTTGKSSKESDVYSFGIVALEIACGRKPDQAVGGVLVEWVWSLYGSRKIVEAADERLRMEFNELEIEHLMVLGLWCAHPDYKARPLATQVFNVLRFESPLPKLPHEYPPTPASPPAAPCVPDNPSSAGLTDTLTGR
ncbi:hypothetical protein MKW94_026461 [Papaver nudicaule]|uniref:non-specific serine/threonine protein kinase n=1 Tax=Papaver nudicaule TaxID=74823 RepID=A0AA41V1J9_PAPNU|nr:hypothetical protein [Papaver nudicaule]